MVCIFLLHILFFRYFFVFGSKSVVFQKYAIYDNVGITRKVSKIQNFANYENFTAFGGI